MTKKDIEGFLSNPFFAAINPGTEIPESVFAYFKEAYERDEFLNERPYKQLLNLYENDHVKNITSFEYEEIFKKDYLAFIKQSVLEYALEEDAIKYFCIGDDYNKIVGLINRRQFTSKAIIKVSNRLSYVLDNLGGDLSKLETLISREVGKLINDYQCEYVAKTLKPLKEVVDKVASGVKPMCYLDFNSQNRDYSISQELRDYVLNKHGYKIIDSYRNAEGALAKILSLALVNDESIWIDTHLYGDTFTGVGKSIFTFLQLVIKHNDIVHAEKIIDYAFAEACKDEKIKFLYDNKLPFFLYYFEEEMIDWCTKRLSYSLSKVASNANISLEEAKGLIYPINKGFDEEIQKGKIVFDNFIKKTYPNDYEKITNIILNVETVIQDEREWFNNMKKRRVTVFEMLEYDLVGYDEVSTKIQYLKTYYKDFESDESVIKRLYYRLYLLDKYSKQLSFECIYEYLYNMFKMIDYKFKYECSFVQDQELRNDNYSMLKSILAKYDLNISDSFKDLYVIALLDRKYATIDEANMFAELEQFGDAIYELAVDNIIFYDSEQRYTLDHQNREKYVKADNQVLVSKKIGLDKAYISRLNDSLNNKMDHIDAAEAGLKSSTEGHYLADSLEMVIAVVAKEFGLQKALDFATKIIVETNEELSMPIIYKNFEYTEMFNSNIDWVYLNKVFPGPFDKESDYRWEYIVLSEALIKLLKICIIGNDTREKRVSLANRINSIGDYHWYQFVYWYLTYGIEDTVKKFEDIVKSSYIKEN